MGLGMPELLVVMGVVLLLFGGQKLPQLASGLGRAIRAFKTAATGADDHHKQLDR
ncbi:MAG TPA: twin-arginine translocase TatA/TatE family subunit [Myxococcota bacterium]